MKTKVAIIGSGNMGTIHDWKRAYDLDVRSVRVVMGR